MKVNLVNENFHSDYLANLLHARGVVNVEDFLQPTDKYLLDPILLDNINQGALWLEETLNKENSKIMKAFESNGKSTQTTKNEKLYI